MRLTSRRCLSFIPKVSSRSPVDKDVYGTDAGGRQRTRILETAGNLKISIIGPRVLLSAEQEQASLRSMLWPREEAMGLRQKLASVFLPAEPLAPSAFR